MVVTFEGGDPDRPLILGSVYNAASPPPEALPASKTKTGIRTSSTPGAHGSNELWFEDAAAREQVFLRAQRDFDQHVLQNRSVRVDNDEQRTIAGRQHERVGGEVEVELGASRETRIQHNETLRVEGNRRVIVQGADEQNVQGSRSSTLSGGDRLEVHGSQNLFVRGDSVARHAGNLTQVIGSAEGPRSAVMHVEGSHQLGATGPIEFKSDQQLTLRCGESMIRLTPDAIELKSKSLVLQGEGARLRITASKVQLQADVRIQGVAEQVLLKSSGAALGLTSEAAVDGSQVLLNSPNSAQDAIEDAAPQLTTIELVDDEGNPLANQPFRIVRADGSELSGALDDEGKAEIELEDDADIIFPGVSDVEES